MSHVDEGVAAAQVVRQGVAPAGGVVVAEFTHDVVRAMYSDYLDGSLAPRERDRVERHLVDCEPCRAYLNTFRTTVDLVRELPAQTAPVRAKNAILRQIRDQP